MQVIGSASAYLPQYAMECAVVPQNHGAVVAFADYLQLQTAFAQPFQFYSTVHG